MAPRDDGGLLISPEPQQLLRETWQNHQMLRASQGQILGVPLARLRGWMRRWMGHREDSVPIIATGHQTELYHPGVWIKNAVIDLAARRIGAQAIHLAVDTDAPKHLVYRWPGGGRPLTEQTVGARWSALLPSPGRGYVEQLQAEAARAIEPWGFRPAWDEFFASLGGEGRSLSAALAQAHEAADRALGLKHQILVASPLWRCAGYLLFAYELCARAGEFADVYNQALAEFRQANGITSPGRPMPDLNNDGEFCEVPFWLDSVADGERKRASVVRSGDRWALLVDEQEFVFDPTVRDGWIAAEQLGYWLNQRGARLSPRALTLTSFLRLAVVDQFVHGIGGAIYDQVADRILATWYGIEPPAFAVATATMFFPAAEKRERTCLECIGREARQLRHGVTGERKIELVKQIEVAPRRSTQRAMLFSQMHRELAEAYAAHPRVAQFTQRYEQAKAAAHEDQQIFDRELPYTLQSRERLRGMVAKVQEQFG